MNVNLFFGHEIDPLSLEGKTILLALAVLLGGLVGLERQIHGNPAGLRTHILVCVGAAMMTMTSVEIGMGVRGGMRGDPAHLAAQIVSGIGFLGAGAILREGGNIHGLTTAASLWATAGMGIALGASPRLAELAVIGAMIVFATLTLLGHLERLLGLKDRVSTLEVEVVEAHQGPALILELLESLAIQVKGIQSEPGPASLNKEGAGTTRQMRLAVRLPGKFDRNHFNRTLLEKKGVVSFRLD